MRLFMSSINTYAPIPISFIRNNGANQCAREADRLADIGNNNEFIDTKREGTHFLDCATYNPAVTPQEASVYNSIINRTTNGGQFSDHITMQGIPFVVLPPARGVSLGIDADPQTIFNISITDNPQHKVTLTAYPNRLFIMETEVTQGHYNSIMKNRLASFNRKNLTSEQIAWFNQTNSAKTLSLLSERVDQRLKDKFRSLNYSDYKVFVKQHPNANLFNTLTKATFSHDIGQETFNILIGLNTFNFVGDTLPAENLTWYNAVNYARELSLQAGDISPEVKAHIRNISCESYIKFALESPESRLYRLPTESEWEFAAHGSPSGSHDPFAWGDDISQTGNYAHMLHPGTTYWSRVVHRPYINASHENMLSTPQPVGQLTPNGFALKDMIGNVWEWTIDWYDKTAFKESEHYTQPAGPEHGNYRVLRGGSWHIFSRRHLFPANRNYNNPEHHSSNIGFRLVRALPPHKP